VGCSWIWLWLAACTTTPNSPSDTGGATGSLTDSGTTWWPPTTGVDFTSCPQERTPVAADERPLGFSAEELLEALALPSTVVWDYTQTDLPLVDTPSDAAFAPLVVREVYLVTYPEGTCEPAEQLLVITDAEIDLGDGGLVATGALQLYAWGTAGDQVQVWAGDELTLTTGGAFAEAVDRWLGGVLTLEALELHVGSSWDTLGVSVEAQVYDGIESSTADLWSGKLVHTR
jgi:hypothetical protein